MMALPWGTVVALRIGHEDPACRMTTDWVKQSGRHSSGPLLLDPTTDDHYYATSTYLGGEVVAGHPKTGLVTVEPFRRPPQRLQLHFSDVKLTPLRGDRANFMFEVTGLSTLAVRINENLPMGQIPARIEEQINAAAKEAEDKSERELKAFKGCLLAALGLLGLIPLAIASLAK